MKVYKGTGSLIFTVLGFTAIAAAVFILLCGIRPAAVVSGSMEPEIMTGSLSFIDCKEKKADVNDIIAYEHGDMRIIHRVAEKKGEVYITKGDNNDTEDAVPVYERQIIGKVIFSMPYLGYAVMLMKTGGGFAAVAVLVFILICGSFAVKKGKDT